jgi:hypothetical protein
VLSRPVERNSVNSFGLKKNELKPFLSTGLILRKQNILNNHQFQLKDRDIHKHR